MLSDLVKIARARTTDIQQTHWEGCERDHRECLIQRMADEIERLREDRAYLLNAARRAVMALAAAAEWRPKFATDYSMLSRSLERFRGEWPTEAGRKE